MILSTLLSLFVSLATAAPLTIDDGNRCASWSMSGNIIKCQSATTPPPVDPPPTNPPPVDPPPSTGWNGTCPGFAKTINATWDWGKVQDHYDTAYAGGIGYDGIVVMEFKPNGPWDNNNLTSISVTGYPAPNAGNYLTLAISNVPCNLSPPDPGASSSTSPSVTYGVGTVGTYWATGKPLGVALTPGSVYYINVAGRDASGARTCNAPQGWNCDVRISLQKPPGH